MRIGLLSPVRRFEDAYLHSTEPLFKASGENLGNFAFAEALWRHVSPEAIFPWDVSREKARERCDLLVFAGANQLGAYTDLGGFAAHLDKIGLPLVAVGLGAQAESLSAPVNLTPGTQRWARVLADLAPQAAPNIGVRGEFTLAALDKLGLADHAVVTGCPSNFLNERSDFHGVLKARIDRRRIDRLAQLVGATGGLYVAQAHLDMVRFARGENARNTPKERQAIHNFLGPDRSEADLDVWRQRHALCFTDATSWMEAMRSCDLTVGARFHGVMLAVQAGAPGGVIAHDSRTMEMCRTMAIPVREAHELPAGFDLADLQRLFAFDIDAYAATRERLRGAYIGLLRGCGIEPSERLTRSAA